jgi:hypothetical protein
MYWNALLAKQGRDHGNGPADDSNLYQVNKTLTPVTRTPASDRPPPDVPDQR